MKESENPAGTCWEGGERESGRQEVPTEIANTTTRLICFFGQHGESKGDKHLAWLARKDVPTSDTALTLLSLSLHLSRQLLLLCFSSPALAFQ